MSLTVNIYYTGQNGNAVKFAEEMVSSGVVNAVRNEKGNLKYEYYFPMDDKETVLLIDCWENQEALDIHHKSPMMEQIAYLRNKYKLKMKVERFNSNILCHLDRSGEV
ncbi:MAG: antibiotic biosynthesis monooxygenase [Clostridia bacterium]|nr:antibiotic biosynthesis monooxygenase [Clostridia bacterium]